MDVPFTKALAGGEAARLDLWRRPALKKRRAAFTFFCLSDANSEAICERGSSGNCVEISFREESGVCIQEANFFTFPNTASKKNHQSSEAASRSVMEGKGKGINSCRAYVSQLDFYSRPHSPKDRRPKSS